MPHRDPLRVLAHDHAELNRCVFALAARIAAIGAAGDPTSRELTGALEELRDPLFFHFSREEEGLFPFVAEIASQWEPQLAEMAVAHDTICGALARMIELAVVDAPASTLTPIFARFEAAYSAHARREAVLFDALERQLGDEHRRRLAVLVASL